MKTGERGNETRIALVQLDSYGLNCYFTCIASFLMWCAAIQLVPNSSAAQRSLTARVPQRARTPTTSRTSTRSNSPSHPPDPLNQGRQPDAPLRPHRGSGRARIRSSSRGKVTVGGGDTWEKTQRPRPPGCAEDGRTWWELVGRSREGLE